MSKKITTTTPPTVYINKEQGWHANTELGCNLKTLLHSNKRMQKNKNYLGVLRRDSEAIVDEFLSRDEHFTFTEVAPRPYACRRNVRLFEGEHITCTKSLTDGMVRLNFKNLKEDAVFNVDSYALEVANEIRKALNGFVEEKLPRE